MLNEILFEEIFNNYHRYKIPNSTKLLYKILFFIKNQYIKDYNKSKYLTLTPVYEKRSQLLLKCKISTI